jgi:hypothetical protein
MAAFCRHLRLVSTTVFGLGHNHYKSANFELVHSQSGGFSELGKRNVIRSCALTRPCHTCPGVTEEINVY